MARASVRVYFVRLLHGRRVCRVAPPIVTSAAIAGTGDLVCQIAIEEHATSDLWRASTMAGIGGACAPALTRWYGRLHRLIPGQHASAIGRRLLLHHCAFAPLLLPACIAAVAVSEGDPPLSKVSHAWWPAVKWHWLIVLPEQALNFLLVPLHFQLLFANGGALLWWTALSWLIHRPVAAANSEIPVTRFCDLAGAPSRGVSRSWAR